MSRSLMPSFRLHQLGCLRPGAAVALAGAMASLAMAVTARAAEPSHATAWVSEHATKVRLIGGTATAPGQPPATYAGIEILLDDGWKTYWRNPGSSGVPPRLEWTGSDNVAATSVLFPAPERFADKDGDTIGYKKHVIIPVAIKANDPSKPVALKLAVEYGVCKDVCIPVQTTLDLVLPPVAAKAEPLLSETLSQVPRAAGAIATDPAVVSVKVDLSSDKPSIEIAARFPGDAAGADAFLEAPDGLWMPLAKATGPQTGPERKFTVDLTDGADLADLKGRDIRLTLVSRGGASETTFKLE